MFKARSGSYISRIIFTYFPLVQFANSKISYIFVYHEASTRILTALSMLSCFLLAFCSTCMIKSGLSTLQQVPTQSVKGNSVKSSKLHLLGCVSDILWGFFQSTWNGLCSKRFLGFFDSLLLLQYMIDTLVCRSFFRDYICIKFKI